MELFTELEKQNEVKQCLTVLAKTGLISFIDGYLSL